MAAADSYRELFKEVDSLAAELDESYDAIVYPDLKEETFTVPDKDRRRFAEGVEQLLEKLQKLAVEPKVDWGFINELEEKGPSTLMPQIGGVRQLCYQAGWYAKETWESDSNKAIDMLISAQAAARHVNQAPSLISKLSQISYDSILLQTYSELAPKMTSSQRAEIIARIQKLPESGSLAQALAAERDYFVGWFRKELLKALEEWTDENLGPDGLRFPEDLRLAGIVALANQPVQISLHDNRNQRKFWLKTGNEVNGIRLEKVELDKMRAFIVHEGKRAVINLKEETIQSRYVPWEVLYRVFVKKNYDETTIDESEMQKELEELGLTPENAFDQLDMIDDFYSEAILRLELPIEEFKNWEKDKLELLEKNKLKSFLIPKVSPIIEKDRQSKDKYRMLELGFTLERGSMPNNTQVIPFKGEDYVVRPNAEGYSITPKISIGHKHEYRYSLHFGTPPPDPKE